MVVGVVIPVYYTVFAGIGGVLVGIALAEIRVRSRQIADRAKRVSDALADTSLMDGVELPKPEDERWSIQDIPFGSKTSRSLTLGQVIVTGLEIIGQSYVLVAGVPLNRGITPAEKRYTSAVWRAYQNRVVRKSLT